MREGLKATLALSFGMVVALVGAELVVRTYQAAFKHIRFWSLLPGYRPTVRFPLSPFLVFGPYRDVQMEGKQRSETSYFNRQGYRSPDTLGPKPAGEYRIIALGGSTTMDGSNEGGIHWPLVAEENLRAAGRSDVRIYNGAMSGYSSAHSLVRLEFDALQYQPDMILVMHNINDLSVNYYALHEGTQVDANYAVKYSRPELTGVLTEKNVVLSRVWHSAKQRVAAILDGIEAPQPLPAQYDIDHGRAIFKRNLRSIVAVARAHGVLVVLFTMPMCDDAAAFVCSNREAGEMLLYPRDFERFRSDFDSYNESIREVGLEEHVPVVDFRRRVPRDTTYWLDVVHHSVTGVRVLGSLAAAELIKLLPPPSQLH